MNSKIILYVIVCFCYISQKVQAQTDLLNQFEHHQLITADDTINYHVFSSKRIESNKKGLLLYIQGSSASSIIQIKESNGQKYMTSAIPLDLEWISDKYDFAIISKKGFPWSMEVIDDIEVPKTYYKHQTLKYRASQANEVLKHLLKENEYDKVVALGHSEGSDVVAELGTINGQITHFGYLSGGGANQLLDFILFIRKEAFAGNMTEEESLKEINSILKKYQEIMDDPDATDKFWSGKTNSYKRWSSFTEPPVENLLQITKPIFAAIGSNDNSVALESFYLIPLEFIRHKKTNLTFKVYPNLNHQFGQMLDDGSYRDEWQNVIADFLAWVDQR